MNIPPSDHVRRKLAPLTVAQLKHLAVLSGVPYGTLRKIRSGASPYGTPNPGVDTVAKFLPHIQAARRAA